MKIWGRTSETEKTQIKDKIAQYCAAISVRIGIWQKAIVILNHWYTQ